MLHTESFGRGPDLIFLHGLFGAGDNWRSIGKALEDNFTVHLLDLPNHGRSSWLENPTLQSLADIINEWIQQQDIHDYALLGHSMGGKVAMQMALNKPVNGLTKLIVADIAPKVYPPHHQAIFKALTSADFTLLKDRKAVDDDMKDLIPNSGVRQFLLKSLHKKDGQLAWRFNVDVLQNRYETVAAAPTMNSPFSQPTLFIKGMNSDYITSEDQATIQSFFPNASAKLIEGAGHWLHAEKPAVFTKIVKDFITEG